MSINYGVIVGRFQVNNLHEGHLELFRQVSEKHDRVIVFVGVTRTVPTKRNPLDFETRKKMIQAEYPDFTILPLRDEKSDQFWSQRLDESIASVSQHTANVTLYGGRDSFAPHYFGVHKVNELAIPSRVSGTVIREKLSNRVMQSADFRAGAIYAASNRFPLVMPTVDVAIFHRVSDHNPDIKVLLGRKPGEDRYRFIGGFVDVQETLEYAAHREAYEETKLDIYSLEYLGSLPVNDWRYQNDPDAKIITSLFVGWSISTGVRPGDDIQAAAWIELKDLEQIPVELVHEPLKAMVVEFAKKRGYINAK